MRRVTVAALAATILVAGGAPAAQGRPGSPTAVPRDVMFVGNNWEGSATVVDARTHRPINAWRR